MEVFYRYASAGLYIALAQYPGDFPNLAHSIRHNTFSQVDLRFWQNAPFSTAKDTSDFRVMGINRLIAHSKALYLHSSLRLSAKTFRRLLR